MTFSKKNIWITGASSGIGKAVAEAMAREKANLILSGRKETAQQVLSTFEKIDGLYHFGGVSQRSFVVETPLEVDRKIFEVNYFGTIALTKAVLPRMIETGGGQIAVTSSIVGKFGFPYRSAYSASKHALHGFFESLRAENKSNKIRVSLIIPGRIQTNISVNALNKDGASHGKMDEGQQKGKTAEASAKIICRKLKKEKKEILVGGKELLMVYIRRFFPSLYYYMSSKVKPL